MPGKKERDCEAFEKSVGIFFNLKEMLIIALTHSSYANEQSKNKVISNERIEFLGDSILSVIITEHLYLYYPNLAEGDLTKVRSNIVCEPTLAQCARNLDLGSYIFLGKGERLSGGKDRDSILADAFEAVIGAIYLDQGFDVVRGFVLNQMKPLIHTYVEGHAARDYKSMLQELVQKKDHTTTYAIIREKGPDHDKLFTAQVVVNERLYGKGTGKTKKEAEQQAAREAFSELKKIGTYD